MAKDCDGSCAAVVLCYDNHAVDSDAECMGTERSNKYVPYQPGLCASDFRDYGYADSVSDLHHGPAIDVGG